MTTYILPSAVSGVAVLIAQGTSRKNASVTDTRVLCNRIRVDNDPRRYGYGSLAPVGDGVFRSFEGIPRNLRKMFWIVSDEFISQLESSPFVRVRDRHLRMLFNAHPALTLALSDAFAGFHHSSDPSQNVDDGTMFWVATSPETPQIGDNPGQVFTRALEGDCKRNSDIDNEYSCFYFRGQDLARVFARREFLFDTRCASLLVDGGFAFELLNEDGWYSGRHPVELISAVNPGVEECGRILTWLMESADADRLLVLPANMINQSKSFLRSNFPDADVFFLQQNIDRSRAHVCCTGDRLPDGSRAKTVVLDNGDFAIPYGGMFAFDKVDNPSLFGANTDESLLTCFASIDFLARYTSLVNGDSPNSYVTGSDLNGNSCRVSKSRFDFLEFASGEFSHSKTLGRSVRSWLSRAVNTSDVTELFAELRASKVCAEPKPVEDQAAVEAVNPWSLSANRKGKGKKRVRGKRVMADSSHVSVKPASKKQVSGDASSKHRVQSARSSAAQLLLDPEIPVSLASEIVKFLSKGRLSVHEKRS